MSVNKSFNGVTYAIPNQPGESGWGTSLSNFLQAVADNAALKTTHKQNVRQALTSPITISATSDWCVDVRVGSVLAAVTLPTGVEGQTFLVCDGYGLFGSYECTVTPTSGIIQGAGSYIMNHNYQATLFQWSNDRWNIVAEHLGPFIKPEKVGNGAVSFTEFLRLASLTSAAVGISDTQTLTNKTISTSSNTVGPLDSVTGTLSASKGGTGLTTVGSALQVLRTNAGATALEWASTGSGDVVGPASSTSGRVAVYNGTTGKLLQDGTKLEADLVTGPASSTDNAIPRFDGTTGKLIQNSGVTVDDSNIIRLLGAASIPIYTRYDQATNNSGKVWRAGHTGGVAGFTTYDIYNETDAITAFSASSAGAVTLGPTSGSGTTALTHTVQADGNATFSIACSSNTASFTLQRFIRGGATQAAQGVSGSGAGLLIADSAENDYCLYTNTKPYRISTNGGSTSCVLISTAGTASLTTTSGHNVILKKSTGSSIAWWADTTGASNVFSIDNSSGTLRHLNNAGTVVTTIHQSGIIGVTTASWGTGGTAIGVSAGNLTTSPSSARYKENIREINAAELDSSFIYQLPVKIFEYKQEKGGKTSFGGIAEEVATILPQLVNYEDYGDGPIPESIAESKLNWLLLEEIKKLKARIEALENK